MKEERMLYQLKSLEKMIIRTLIQEEKISNLPTPTQMQIMEYILEHSGQDVYQKDLEDILNLRRATVSGVLQTMEKNNLIVRIMDDKDARIKKIKLNSKAKKMFLKHDEKLIELEKVILNGISDNELSYFFNILDKMKENLRRKSLEEVAKERKND